VVWDILGGQVETMGFRLGKSSKKVGMAHYQTIPRLWGKEFFRISPWHS
jgi:hypothetical protein